MCISLATFGRALEANKVVKYDTHLLLFVKMFCSEEVDLAVQQTASWVHGEDKTALFMSFTSNMADGVSSSELILAANTTHPSMHNVIVRLEFRQDKIHGPGWRREYTKEGITQTWK